MSKRYICLALGLSWTGTAFGQALINSGSSQFGFSSATDNEISGSAVRTGTGGGGNSVFVSLGAPDIQFQNWWWYRVNSATVNSSAYSDTREYAFSQLISKTVTGNNMSLHYGETTDGTPSGFPLISSDIHYGITNGGGGTLVTSTNFITNLTDSAIDVSIFGYVDYDLSGSADSASLIGDLTSGAFRVTGANRTADYRWNNASAYQVSSFSTLRTMLTNSTVDNLNNSGLPFGPADFTGAVQFNLTLGVRETQGIQISYFTAPVPEPASLLVLSSSLLLLVRRRRRS